MAEKTTRNHASNPRQRNPSRPSITLELVRAVAPSHTSVEKLATTFGLNPVDYDHIREVTKNNLIQSAETLQGILSETAMTMHMQRTVTSFVISAHRAAGFYINRVLQARELSSKLTNEDRDEDREGVYGFESRAARFRQFAAEAGLSAYALMAVAEAAVAAHLHVTGEDWRPYAPREDVSRRAAATELAAFE
jgi:hypothetical protein